MSKVVKKNDTPLVPGLATINGMIHAAQGMNDTAAVHTALALRQLCKLDEIWAQCEGGDGNVDPEKLNIMMQAMSKEAKITRQAAEHLERAMVLKHSPDAAQESRFAQAIEDHKGN